jgi:hypothetical protein
VSSSLKTANENNNKAIKGYNISESWAVDPQNKSTKLFKTVPNYETY